MSRVEITLAVVVWCTLVSYMYDYSYDVIYCVFVYACVFAGLLFYYLAPHILEDVFSSLLLHSNRWKGDPIGFRSAVKGLLKGRKSNGFWLEVIFRWSVQCCFATPGQFGVYPWTVRHMGFSLVQNLLSTSFFANLSCRQSAPQSQTVRRSFFC
jgi:hypothetical protein